MLFAKLEEVEVLDEADLKDPRSALEEKLRKWKGPRPATRPFNVWNPDRVEEFSK
ncbi:hypothetical protein ACFXI8_15695 [Streptomyces niveus]|uniref:hypothetical protein n=1 Tax=Streptomyces niveus TaxID=193462 RepID=UPI003692AF0B